MEETDTFLARRDVTYTKSELKNGKNQETLFDFLKLGQTNKYGPWETGVSLEQYIFAQQVSYSTVQNIVQPLKFI